MVAYFELPHEYSDSGSYHRHASPSDPPTLSLLFKLGAWNIHH
jgi:hypothetical protein